MSNVLIVEADAIVRNLMIRVLSRQGYTVFEAATAAEALELCKSFSAEPIDLLIADHETTEPAVAEQILASCANTKVLHISGWPYDLVLKKQALIPGSSFLQKPFTASELLNTVQTLLYPRMQ